VLLSFGSHDECTFTAKRPPTPTLRQANGVRLQAAIIYTHRLYLLLLLSLKADTRFIIAQRVEG